MNTTQIGAWSLAERNRGLLDVARAREAITRSAVAAYRAKPLASHILKQMPCVLVLSAPTGQPAATYLGAASRLCTATRSHEQPHAMVFDSEDEVCR